MKAREVACTDCGAPGRPRVLVAGGRVLAFADACDTHWKRFLARMAARSLVVAELVACGRSRAEAHRAVDRMYAAGVA